LAACITEPVLRHTLCCLAAKFLLSGKSVPVADSACGTDPETEVAGADFPCEGLVSSRFGAGRRVASRRSAVANVARSW
jgi:hypothetical protein